jgi:PRTRC genetic system protein A
MGRGRNSVDQVSTQPLVRATLPGIVDAAISWPISPDFPPVRAAMYEYWLAGNGVFVRGKREGLEAMVLVAPAQVKGLPELTPYCHLQYPPLPAGALELILDLSRQACSDGRKMREALFHIEWTGGQWKLHFPDQEASGASVLPKETEQGEGTSYARCIIEVHSHHQMKAFFSGTDNADEQGFRLYGVLGEIFERPTLRLRVGVYGDFMEVPASVAFELPKGITDNLNTRAGHVRRVSPERDYLDIDLPPIEADEAESAGQIDEPTGLWLPSGAREQEA